MKIFVHSLLTVSSHPLSLFFPRGAVEGKDRTVAGGPRRVEAEMLLPGGELGGRTERETGEKTIPLGRSGSLPWALTLSRMQAAIENYARESEERSRIEKLRDALEEELKKTQQEASTAGQQANYHANDYKNILLILD